MTSPDRTAAYSVFVVGSGAREHALVWALANSPSVSEIWAAPGNPGIATIAQTVGIPITNVDAIVAIPGFPGAAQISLTDGDRARAHAKACSLAPEPTTRTEYGSVRTGGVVTRRPYPVSLFPVC